MLRLILTSLTLGIISSTTYAAGKSESARKKLYLQLEGHAGSSGIGGGIGLFLPGDTRLDLSYSENSISWSGYGTSRRIYRVELQSFVANSFYYTLGATHQRYDYHSGYVYDGDEDSYGVRSHVESNAVHFAIGNEWQWDRFFIGAEWFGFVKPLSWSYENEYGVDVSASARASWDEDAEKFGKTSYLILPTLFIGFSF